MTLIDHATGAVMGTLSVSPSELPESLESTELETTLHLEDGDWVVVEASHRTRTEYSAAGRLELRLRRDATIQSIDPNDLLYSLPSICDRIPALSDNRLKGDECRLGDDDWRQVELVSLSHAHETERQIQAIYQIHQDDRVEGSGWRNIHVRQGPDPPIIAALTRADIERAFDVPLKFAGVAYYGAESTILDGFSFKAPDGLQCYGVEEGGTVRTLGVHHEELSKRPFQSMDSLKGLAREFELELVSWCRCGRAAWNSPLFDELIHSADP